MSFSQTVNVGWNFPEKLFLIFRLYLIAQHEDSGQEPTLDVISPFNGALLVEISPIDMGQ